MSDLSNVQPAPLNALAEATALAAEAVDKLAALGVPVVLMAQIPFDLFKESYQDAPVTPPPSGQSSCAWSTRPGSEL